MPAKKKMVKGKKPPKGVVPPQLRGWLEVVSRMRKAHPTMAYGEVLKRAKVEYRKLKKSVGL